ncbi:MAG: aminoacyl-tRNA hydrolase [Anaerolineaceae bacterium]|nr:aminoacyl-tRNA hydrolase [Anaerolineaceae bacterium]
MKKLLQIFGKNKLDTKKAPILIIGLGNPGREYKESRHNVGFMAIDAMMKHWGVSMLRVQSKAIIGKERRSNQQIILGKPQTFMNLSGQSVAPLVRFYKVPQENLMVIHDDMDLPFGVIRIRKAGGSAGQKGLNSIIEQLGSQDFPRMRIGIGKPPGRMSGADYVLQRFSKNEVSDLDFIMPHIVEAVETFIKSGIEQTMNKYNGSALKD